MAVKDVFRPSSTNPVDPSTKEKDEGKESEFQRKAKDAKAELEYLEQQRRIDRIGQPEQPKEPPFQVKGSINVGDINWQQMLQQQQAERDALRLEAEQNAKDMATANADLREKLHGKDLELIAKLYEKDREIFNTQMQKLSQTVEAGASKKTFMEQFNEAKQTAEVLGMTHPSPETGDFQTRLALKKLDFDQTLELRRLAKEERAEGRRWTLELRKMDDERDARRQEEERQKKRDEMFAQAPTVIGGALAKGMMEAETKKPPSVSGGRARQHIEAPVGEGGEIECAVCGQPVAIGPTAKGAVCASCGTKYSVRRTEPAPAEEEE